MMLANKSKEISPYPHSNHNPQLRIIFKRNPLKRSNTSSHSKKHHHSLKLSNRTRSMAAMNSNVLACSYALLGVTGASELSTKATSLPVFGSSGHRMPVIKAQLQEGNQGSQGRRAALLGLAAIVAATASSSPANAGVIEEYLEKSKANKELNDKKRLATSGANFARAFTVQFGSCKFPENFTGCQDLAKQKKVPFISEDLQLECEGKDKYKCGSNVFWKW